MGKLGKKAGGKKSRNKRVNAEGEVITEEEEDSD